MRVSNSPPKATIRPLQITDIANLRDVTIQMLTDAPHAFGETLAEVEARTADDWVKFAEHFTDDAHARAFLAEDGQGVCGLVCVDAADPRPPQGTVLLTRLWVAPRWRGTGQGKALMETATQWAIAHGADQIALGVTEVNQEGLKFYQHLGYHDTGIRAPWPADPTKDILILSRRLKPE